MNVWLSSDFLKFFIPLVGAVAAWFANEHRKRSWEEYQRKEANYRGLIESLKGFYDSHESGERKRLKNAFIDQLNLCWLYCPDEVIRKAYSFVNKVGTGNSASADEKQQALGCLILEIRKDLLSRKIVRKTHLDGLDFRSLTSN